MENKNLNPKSTGRKGPKLPDKEYLKFTGLAFEICAIIGLGIWAGYALDEYFSNAVPWITVLFAFVSVLIAIVFLYNKLPKS